jgi:hypothetical protein
MSPTLTINEQDVEKAIQILLKERNDHFANLYEKARLYKETFVEIVFDNIEYNPDDEDQTWLEQYGLIRNIEGYAVVANNIYKARYIKTFFKEVKAYEDISIQEYVLPGDRLDMRRILLNFEQYITQIGVRAFYKKDKPYEKTGQFLLTAWLYQFVGVEKGIAQVSRKYLASEAVEEGYLVIFDTKTQVGVVNDPKEHKDSDKKIISFIIGIGKEAG